MQRFSFVNGWLSNGTSGQVTLTGGGSTTVDQISIINSEIIGTGAATYGVTATDITRLVLDKNRFQRFSGSAISLTAVVGCNLQFNTMIAGIGTGVTLATTSDYCTVMANDLRGATTKLTNTSSGTHHIIRDNPPYNPVGNTTPTVTASPWTYKNGPSPSTYVSFGGTITGMSLNGAGIINAAGNPWIIPLGPNDTVVTTYTVAPVVTVITD